MKLDVKAGWNKNQQDKTEHEDDLITNNKFQMIKGNNN